MPSRTALVLGDDSIFFEKLIGGQLKGFLCLKQASAGLAAKLKIPILSDLLRVDEAFLLRGGAVVPAL
ncbi:MAG: hypothetical protein WA624_13915 [Methylocella sp.]